MDRDKDPLPEEFASLEEIQDFWDSHSSADYWDEMEEVEVELVPALRDKIDLRRLYRLLHLSAGQIARIEAAAANARIDGRQLVRRWVLEHV